MDIHYCEVCAVRPTRRHVIVKTPDEVTYHWYTCDPCGVRLLARTPAAVLVAS